MNNKSQIFSLDMIFALIVFVFIVISTFWAWHLTEERINYFRVIRDINVIGKNSMSHLVNSYGEPENWHFFEDEKINETRTFGLIEGGTASQEKIDRLINLGKTEYNLTKEILGIIGPGYEYYLEIGENSTGLLYTSSNEVIGIDRAMVLANGTKINVIMRIWR